MRVNIQYSTNRDEIPQEINDTLQGVVTRKLTRLSNIVKSMNCDNTKVLEQLHEVRKDLFFIDERLQDIDGILRGYFSSFAEQQSVEETQVPHEIDENSAPVNEQTMNLIKAKLKEHSQETEALRRTFQNWEDDESEA